MNKSAFKTVLFYDHNWSHIKKLVIQFSRLSKNLNIKIILLSDRQKSEIVGNLEIINILDVNQVRNLQELQQQYSFSLHKALVPERAYYDYSSFDRYQCYCRLSEEEIGRKVTPYVNALDFVIRERVDLIIEWFPDNFLSSMIPKIAMEYKKPCALFLPYYWWKNGALIIDKPNTTSSVIDQNYDTFYDNPDLLDIAHLQKVFEKKQTIFFIKKKDMYRWKDRFELIINRQKGYQPVSLINWFMRRLSTILSVVIIKLKIQQEMVPGDEPFIVFPLHISPEAAILGPSPELADQFSLIKNISMNLPYGVKLYVKRHPSEIFGLGLGYDFYRRLQALPNVRIFSGKANLNKMIDHPKFIAVAILTGTTAIEAALKKKPVFMFGNSFFSKADCFIKPANFQEFYEKLILVMRGGFKFNERALNAMLGALDKSIVRADIDLTAQSNSTDLASQLPFIWKSYVVSKLNLIPS